MSPEPINVVHSLRQNTLVEIKLCSIHGRQPTFWDRRAAHSHPVTWSGKERVGVAKVTSQGAGDILVEGRHPLSVVFHGLEKPPKLRFVAVNSICEALNHDDAPLGGIVGHLVNCGEGQSQHTSFDKSCPAYAKEKEINSIKANRNISFREAREIYNETHPTISYARKVTSSVTSKPATLEQMSAPQLVELLKSFGLAVVAAGAGGAVLSGPTNPAAPAAPAVPAAAAPMPPSDVEPEEGWTLVQRRRVAGRRSPSPARAAPASAQAHDHHRIVVQEALRRGEAERKAREAKRARLAEKAREGKRSPGADSTSATSSRGASVTPETPQTGSPSRMPPPPPPPPLPRRRPPPLMTPATPVSRPQQAASKQSQPPSGPDRPVKRAPPWKGSPTERGNPRSRLKLQASSGAARSVSADGRPHQEGSGHPRILYGESPSSGAEELV